MDLISFHFHNNATELFLFRCSNKNAEIKEACNNKHLFLAHTRVQARVGCHSAPQYFLSRIQAHRVALSVPLPCLPKDTEVLNHQYKKQVVEIRILAFGKPAKRTADSHGLERGCSDWSNSKTLSSSFRSRADLWRGDLSFRPWSCGGVRKRWALSYNLFGMCYIWKEKPNIQSHQDGSMGIRWE